MATYTRQNLVRDTLLELGLLDPNESPSATDYTTVDAVAQQRLESLYEDGLLPFQIDGAIPARYFRALVKVIAHELVGTYGVLPRAEIAMARRDEGIRELWRLRDVSPPAPIRADYF